MASILVWETFNLSLQVGHWELGSVQTVQPGDANAHTVTVRDYVEPAAAHELMGILEPLKHHWRVGRDGDDGEHVDRVLKKEKMPLF